jgi:hypothetical protein
MEPLPIYALAIEHAEGVILVDTGEDARASPRSYFARGHPGLRAFREWVEPEQEIGPRSSGSASGRATSAGSC